jgi:hypothetical protein
MPVEMIIISRIQVGAATEPRPFVMVLVPADYTGLGRCAQLPVAVLE